MHHPPRKFPPAILAAVAALVGAGAAPAIGATARSHHSGHVPVDDHAAGQNTIAAFAR